jgi:hypothetical protein
MPPDPRRVQALFLKAADGHDRADCAAILDRACSADLELRRRVEALLRAHDEINSFADDPVDPTEARYGRMLNEKQTSANQWVGVLLLSGRGDKTRLELFIAGVRGWEAYPRRRLDNGKPVGYVA